MDLNSCFKRHQISLFMAENAACARERIAHRGFARAYASEIAHLTSGYGRVCPV